MATVTPSRTPTPTDNPDAFEAQSIWVDGVEIPGNYFGLKVGETATFYHTNRGQPLEFETDQDRSSTEAYIREVRDFIIDTHRTALFPIHKDTAFIFASVDADHAHMLDPAPGVRTLTEGQNTYREDNGKIVLVSTTYFHNSYFLNRAANTMYLIQHYPSRLSGVEGMDPGDNLLMELYNLSILDEYVLATDIYNRPATSGPWLGTYIFRKRWA